MAETREERKFYQALECLFPFFEVAGVRSLAVFTVFSTTGVFLSFLWVRNCVENCHYLKTKQIIIIAFKAVCCVSHCHNPPVCQIQGLRYNFFRYVEMAETVQKSLYIAKANK